MKWPADARQLVAGLIQALVSLPPTRGGGTHAAHTVYAVCYLLPTTPTPTTKRIASTGATSSRRSREVQRARSLTVPHG